MSPVLKRDEKGEKAAESQPDKKYLGRPYQGMGKARFAEILKKGCTAVIEASYIEKRLAK